MNPLRAPSRVMLLGDSVTRSGGWAAILQHQLDLQFGEQAPQVHNRGLSSETVSGLSEPRHPFPRPGVLDRVDEEIDGIRPDVTVVAYGINDGIYAPFDRDRFAAFTGNYRALVTRLHRAGSTVVALTPNPLEIQAWPESERRTVGLSSSSYSYLTPFVDYDADVLARYSAWLVDELSADISDVVDVRPVFETHRARSGGRLTSDGIHPGALGHELIARAVLEQAFGLRMVKAQGVPGDEEVASWTG